jgi:hypothetical protein
VAEVVFAFVVECRVLERMMARKILYNNIIGRTGSSDRRHMHAVE